MTREFKGMEDYRYTLHCVFNGWIGKPDPSGFGRFTFSTDDIDKARRNIEGDETKRGYGKILRVVDRQATP